MSITERLEDAEILLKNNRTLGAVTILLTAIDATARKYYPKGTMKPSKAFSYFLGSRIKSILLNNSTGPYPRNSGLTIEYRGEQKNVEDVIYEFCRCALIHEATMTPDISIEKEGSFVPQLTLENNGEAVSIRCGEKLILGSGWIDLFFAVVRGARLNNTDLIDQRTTLVANENFNVAEFHNSLAQYYITRRRVDKFRELLQAIGPEKAKMASLEENQTWVSTLLRGGLIEDIWVERLIDRKMITPELTMTDLGLTIFNTLRENYILVNDPEL